MRSIAVGACAVVLGLAAGSVEAKPITSPEQSNLGSSVVVDFKELKGKDQSVFGSPAVGQPYAVLGLVLPSQMVVENANLTPDNTMAVRSIGVSEVGNASIQTLLFPVAQRSIGFSVRSEKATSVHVVALDKEGNVLDETVLPASADTRFVGFARDARDIAAVRVVAPHATMGDAVSSPTYITGISFDYSSTGTGDPSELMALGSGGGGGAGSTGGIGGGVDLGMAGGSGAGRYSPLGYGASMGVSGGLGNNNNNNPNNSNFRNVGTRNPNLPPQPIPEPATIALSGLGAAMLLRRKR